MRTPAASQLVVTSTTPVYSQPIPSGGLSGVSLDLTVVSAYTAGTATIAASIEESSDLQTWTPVALTATVAGAVSAFPAYTTCMTTSVGSAITAGYVRVAFTADTGRACLAAGVNFFNFST